MTDAPGSGRRISSGVASPRNTIATCPATGTGTATGNEIAWTIAAATDTTATATGPGIETGTATGTGGTVLAIATGRGTTVGTRGAGAGLEAATVRETGPGIVTGTVSIAAAGGSGACRRGVTGTGPGIVIGTVTEDGAGVAVRSLDFLLRRPRLPRRLMWCYRASRERDLAYRAFWGAGRDGYSGATWTLIIGWAGTGWGPSLLLIPLSIVQKYVGYVTGLADIECWVLNAGRTSDVPRTPPTIMSL
jgi:hypothetical protein